MSRRSGTALLLPAVFTLATAAGAADRLSIRELRERLAAPPTRDGAQMLAAKVRRWFVPGGQGKATPLHRPGLEIQGLQAAWAVEASGANTASIELADGQSLPMARIGGTTMFVATRDFPDGTALHWSCLADASRLLGDGRLETFREPAEYIPRADRPHGRLARMPDRLGATYPGTRHIWWTYVPSQYDERRPACVMVFLDGPQFTPYVPTLFDNLIAAGEMPVTVSVFVSPGIGSGGEGLTQRSFEYDRLDDRYARFLLEEILPAVEERVRLRPEPEARAIAGMSSGGIAAWTVAWQRPDAFRKVVSWVGSFTNIAAGPTGLGGGHNYEALIRRSPRKPIRIFLQDGSRDLDTEAGNWPLANQQMARALAYRGYDYWFAFGPGFHSDRHGRSLLPDTLRWLWRDQATIAPPPVAAGTGRDRD